MTVEAFKSSNYLESFLSLKALEVVLKSLEVAFKARRSKVGALVGAWLEQKLQ